MKQIFKYVRTDNNLQFKNGNKKDLEFQSDFTATQKMKIKR